MVQLIEKSSTSKVKKSAMGKVKTPEVEHTHKKKKVHEEISSPKVEKTSKKSKKKRSASKTAQDEPMQAEPKQEAESESEVTPEVKHTRKHKKVDEEISSPKTTKTSKKSKKKRSASENAQDEPMQAEPKQEAESESEVTPEVKHTHKQKKVDEEISSTTKEKTSKKSKKKRSASETAQDEPMQAEDSSPKKLKTEYKGRSLYAAPQEDEGNRKRKFGESFDDQPSKRRAVEEDPKEIFIKNLKAITSSADLEEYFSKFGKIEKVSLPKTERDSKFGFVKFVKEDSLDKVFAEKQHVIQGYEFNVRAKKLTNSAMNGVKKDLTKKFEIRVLGLATNLKKEDLREYFEKFGTVSDVTLPMNWFGPTGRNKGFAFVAFSSEAEMQAALSHERQTIGGAEVTCVVNNPLKQLGAADGNQLTREFEVRINDLDFDITRQDLQEYFEKFGTVSCVTLPFAKLTGKNRGFAFVAFTNAKEVKACMKVKEHKIGSHVVKVVLNEDKDKSS